MTLMIHTIKRFTQLKYKCPCLLCPGSRCVQTMQANLVNGLYIKSTGLHEVLHHGQVTKIGCKVQGCVSVLIRVKEVALHFGGKVLGNGKMAFHGTQVKGISSILQGMIGQAHNRSQPTHTCMVHRRRFNAPLSNTMPRCVQHTYCYTHHILT